MRRLRARAVRRTEYKRRFLMWGQSSLGWPPTQGGLKRGLQITLCGQFSGLAGSFGGTELSRCKRDSILSSSERVVRTKRIPVRSLKKKAFVGDGVRGGGGPAKELDLVGKSTKSSPAA